MPQINIRWADNTEQLKKNLKEGVQQIEATKASVDKLAKAFSGENLIAAAHKYAAAVEQIGGAGKLTAANQERVNGVMSRAVQQMEAAGQGSSALANHFRELADATKKVETPTSALSTWMGDLRTNILSTAAGFVSAQAVLNAVSTGWHALTGFVGDSVKAYAAAEVAQTKLTTAMRIQGMFTPAVVSQYAALSEQFQRTTVFSDDLVTEMQALLIQVGNVMPSQMERALDAATNLASGLGIDLETATTLVAKAAAGHTETLGRYGIQVDQAAVKTQGLDAVLQSINKQFGGQAAAQIETYAGKVKQLENNWDNVKEAVGKAIANDPLVTRGLDAIKNAADHASASQFGLADSLKKLYGLMPIGGPLFKALIDHYESVARSANEAAAAQQRAAKFQESNKPLASHDTETEKRERAARDATAARDRQKKLDEEAAKAAEAYQKALDAVNKKIREGEAPIATLSEAQQRLILHFRDLKLSNEDIALKMRLTVRTVEDFTEKTDAAATAVKGLKDTVLSGPVPGLRLYDASADVAELQKFIDRLRAIEDGSFRPKIDPSLLTGPIPGLPVFKPDLPIEKVDAFHRALSSVEQVLGGIQSTWANMAVVASRTIDAVSAKLASGDWIGAATAGVAGVVQLFQNIGGPSKLEVEGRALQKSFQDQFRSFEDMLTSIGRAYLLTGKTLEQARADVKLLLDAEKEGPEAVQKIIDKLQGALDAAREIDAAIGGLGIKSTDDLQHAADVAREAFEKVLAGVKTGQFTEADALKAEIAYQKAIAALGGEAGKAAEAWLRLHDAASRAGDAQSDAMKKAASELEALIQKRDSLAAAIGKEAPEEFIGVVEQQQRAELKALDEEIQRKADAYAKLAKDTGEAMADAIREALERLHVTINVDYNLPPVPTPSYGGGYDPNSPTYGKAGEAPEYAARGGTMTARGLLPQYFGNGGTMLPSLSIPSTLFIPRGEDRYPAMLAAGETVRTKAQEAALWEGGQASVTVGSLVVNVAVSKNVDADEFTDIAVEAIRTKSRLYEAVGTVARRATT